MEWEGFQCSPLDECWYNNMLPNQFNVEKSSIVEWSFEENMVFETILAEQVEAVGSPAFFQNLATMIPYKSMHDIKVHFEALVKDIQMIESGCFPIPDYKTQDDRRILNDDVAGVTNPKNDNGSPSNETKRTSSGQQRRRGIPWTEEEHQLFLMGLNKYGKGDWRSISRYYVITKTPTQIASHAQKYFRRQTSTTPMDRRRPSIHDIQTVTHPATNMPMPTVATNSAPAPLQFQRTTTVLMNNNSASINHEQDPNNFSAAAVSLARASCMNNQQWG